MSRLRPPAGEPTWVAELVEAARFVLGQEPCGGLATTEPCTGVSRTPAAGPSRRRSSIGAQPAWKGVTGTTASRSSDAMTSTRPSTT